MSEEAEIPKISAKESASDIFAHLPESVQKKSEMLGQLRSNIYKGCAVEVARNGFLHEWSYERVKQFLIKSQAWDFPEGTTPFATDLSLWDVQETQQGSQYNSLLQHLETVHDKLVSYRTQLASISEEVAHFIDRPKIIQDICNDLMVQLHLDPNSDLIKQYIQNIQYDPQYPKARTFLNENTITGATPEHLSPDCLLNRQYLDDDIAFVKHEFVHFLRRNGKIKCDTFVPIASAITSLEFLQGRKSHSGWNVKQEEIDTVNKTIDEGADIEAVYCSLVIPHVKGSTSREKIASQLAQQQIGEPEWTYSGGRALGTLIFLLEQRAKQHGIDLTANTILARLAHGEFPGDVIINEQFQQLKKKPSD